VDAPSAPFLDSAVIDFASNATGGQLSIKAPRIKGDQPQGDASLVERVQWLIDSEINPQLASHKGKVALDSIDADGVVYLRFGGGCHGCGMVDVTLKQGIEKSMIEKFPEVTAVRDATDHSTGSAPYIARG
jgi:Fe/S biogenesis protein NfuA